MDVVVAVLAVCGFAVHDVGIALYAATTSRQSVVKPNDVSTHAVSLQSLGPWVITHHSPGNKNQAEFGTMLRPVPDVDRDGYSDVVLGIPVRDAPEGALPQACVFLYGGKCLTQLAAEEAVPDMEMRLHFRYPDNLVVCGSPDSVTLACSAFAGLSRSTPSRGEIYLYGAGTLTLHGIIASNAAYNDGFGLGLATSDDPAGAPGGRLWVGRPFARGQGDLFGSVAVYDLSTQMICAEVSNNSKDDNYAFRLGRYHDVDRDGLGDTWISSSNGFRVYSSRTFDELLTVKPYLNQPTTQFFLREMLEDKNCDEVADYIAEVRLPNAGRTVGVWSGNESRWLAQIQVPSGAPANFGQKCIQIPDVDGDGWLDLCVSATGKGRQYGAVFVLSGSDYQVLSRLDGHRPGGGFGFDMAVIVDSVEPRRVRLCISEPSCPPDHVPRSSGDIYVYEYLCP